MVHVAAEIKAGALFSDCISCHELGSTGQQKTAPADFVINIITKTHFCDECHYTGYGLPGPNTPEYEGILNTRMDRNKLTHDEINESCTICHKPAP